MRIESSARTMEKRLSEASGPPRPGLSNTSRKSKRRGNRRGNPLDALPSTWVNGPRSEQESLVPNVEYPPQMLWQSTGVPQNVPGNGQRLFTAMSDPSVCGYSPVPLTYTMQPVSLPPMYRMYQPMAMPNVRTVHGRHRRQCNEHLANICPNANNNVNGYGGLRENGTLESTMHIAHQNGDYASLPATANKDSGINSDEMNSEQRRYSDPGLGPAENLPHSDSSDDSDSIESGSSVTTISRSNKLVLSLIEQMTELKKYNNQLFKELSETKSYVENIKEKLAQCKHNTSTDYQPGMLSGLIGEIREANKNCEEGLVTKVKSMLEEKCHQQTKEMEELKNQLSKLTKEKEESDERVAKLEEELMVLKLSATMEKLVDILRKKVNGPMEAVSRIRDVLASDAYHIPQVSTKEPMSHAPLSSSSSSEDEEEVEDDDENNDDDDDIHKPDAFKSDRDSIASDSKTHLVIDSNVNLSGPVTDL